jgi:hypothetical protein
MQLTDSPGMVHCQTAGSRCRYIISMDIFTSCEGAKVKYLQEK